MEKLTIQLEQNQFCDFVERFEIALDFWHHETLGTVILYDQILKRMRKRYNRCNPMNGLCMYRFRFYVYDWELALLVIAKAGHKQNVYGQITINTILEKLNLHEQTYAR